MPKELRMSHARVRTLASMRKTLARLETTGAPDAGRVALGHKQADTALNGGLMRGALHEVFAEGLFAATATGFVAGLAARLAERRVLLWIRQDFAAREAGELAMSGFAEFGLDPRRIVVVRAKDADTVLRIASDGVACRGVGAVIAELFGETRAFDAVASRKLTLGCATAGVSCLMLRLAASPQTSTAETRWIVRAAHSPPSAAWEAWGAPVFDAALVRNRHGSTGHWIMKWKCDECLFSDTVIVQPAAHSQPVAATVADRPAPANRPARRKTG
jgi:protein ImuA